MATETKTIRVSTMNYNRLSTFKRNNSFDTHIGIMLNYFAVTNIAPESCQTHPAIERNNRIESQIAISKAHEKQYFKPMLELLQTLVSGTLPERVGEDSGEYVGNTLRVEELKHILDDRNALQDRADLQSREINRLNDEIARHQRANKDTGKNINPTVIKQCLDELSTKITNNRFAEDMYQIPKDDFNAIIERIRMECL